MDIMSSVVRVTCLCVVRKVGRVSTGRSGGLGASGTRMVRLCVGGRARRASAVAAVGEARARRCCLRGSELTRGRGRIARESGNGLEQATRSGSWMAMSHAEQVVGGFVVLHSRARETSSSSNALDVRWGRGYLGPARERWARADPGRLACSSIILLLC